MPRFRRPFSAVWLCTCLLAVLAPRIPLCYGAFDPVIDSPMYDAPRLPAPGVEFTLPEETIVLWLKALKRPEADMRRLAADAVVLAQRRGEPGVLGRGAAVLGLPTAPLGPGPLLAAFAVVPVNPRMPDLDRFIESLSQTLDQPDQHPAVRLAAARALIALNVQSSAPSLFQHSQSDGEDMREVVEPALARWNYRPARTVWMARLRDAATPQRSLVLAIQGLKAVGEPLAGDPLQEIALSASRAAPIRLEAARALGTLRTDGLEHDADSLAADAMPSGLLGRLLAVALLRRHRSENAVQLLQRLAADAEPTVAAPAVARLLEIDPDLVTPTVGRLLASPDANLRSEAVDALYSRPTLDGLDLLAARLEDDDPAVRVQARAALLRLADNPEFRDRVIADASRVLEETKDHWRGLEQATILLTQLDYKPAAKQMLKLLPIDRPEVAVTAGWGLRTLADLDTLQPVLTYVTEKREQTLKGKDPFSMQEQFRSTLNHQLSQLIQFLGRARHKDAEAVLRQFVPRNGDAGLAEARAAAIWALGRLHEGTPDAGLAKQLIARLDDVNSIPPEDGRVRRMAAVALGQMQAVEALPHLRTYCSDNDWLGDAVHDGCGWAIEQLDPKSPMNPPKTRLYPYTDWFLKPDH